MILVFILCEHQEHVVRMPGTLGALFRAIWCDFPEHPLSSLPPGANFVNILCLPFFSCSFCGDIYTLICEYLHIHIPKFPHIRLFTYSNICMLVYTDTYMFRYLCIRISLAI